MSQSLPLLPTYATLIFPDKMPIYFFRSMGVSCSERSSKCNFDSRLKNPTNRGILWAILVNCLCAPKLAHGHSPLPPSSLQKSNPRGAARWNLGDKSADSAETKPSTGHQAELRRVTNSRTIYRQLRIPRYRYRPKTTHRTVWNYLSVRWSSTVVSLVSK